MESKGFMQAPMLEVDGEILNYDNAVQWAFKQKGQQ